VNSDPFVPFYGKKFSDLDQWEKWFTKELHGQAAKREVMYWQSELKMLARAKNPSK
jgi:hypothetical protein